MPCYVDLALVTLLAQAPEPERAARLDHSTGCKNIWYFKKVDQGRVFGSRTKKTLSKTSIGSRGGHGNRIEWIPGWMCASGSASGSG